MNLDKISFPRLAALLGDSGKFDKYKISKINYDEAKDKDTKFPIAGNEMSRVLILKYFEPLYPNFLNCLDQQLRRRSDYQDDEGFTPWISITVLNAFIDIIAYCLHQRGAYKERESIIKQNIKELQTAQKALKRISLYKNLFPNSQELDKKCVQVSLEIGELFPDFQQLQSELDKQREADTGIDRNMRLALEDMGFFGKTSNKLIKALILDLKKSDLRVYHVGLTQRASESYDRHSWFEKGKFEINRSKKTKRKNVPLD